MSTPFPTNPIASVVDQAIDGIAGIAAQISEAATDAAIFAAVPELNLPILDVLTEGAVKIIESTAIQEFYKVFATLVTFEIIVIEGAVENSDQQKAFAALKAAQKTGDSNAIQAALLQCQKTTVGVTHIDGSVSI